MLSLLGFLARRLITVPLTLLVITATLYGLAMLAPPERRAYLYLPKNIDPYDVLSDSPLLQAIIKEHRLDDPFPVQYFNWLSNLLRGDWGISIWTKRDVLEYLVVRTPVTVELMLLSALTFIPLGTIAGVTAAARRGQRLDHGVQLAAAAGTSIPLFVTAMVLVAFFYVGLQWFPIGRASDASNIVIRSGAFQTYTGLLTIDGLLNGRPDITFDALRHLVLPVMTLSLAQWATLSRVTRVSVVDQLDLDYVTVAYGKGLSSRRVVWGHAVRNALAQILTSSALSAASLVTGVYLVELLFNRHGISDMFRLTAEQTATFNTFDPAPAMGLAVYTVLIVLAITFVLDVMQAVADPLLRREKDAA
jgi:peptide/nickel transport system permease protein